MGNLTLRAIESDPQYADNRSPDVEMMEQEEHGGRCQHCGRGGEPRRGAVSNELIELARKNPGALHVTFLRLNQPELTEREIAEVAGISQMSVSRYLHAAAAAAPGLRNELLYKCRKGKGKF